MSVSFQHAALFQIADECRLWLVDVFRLLGNVGGQATVLVPTAVIELHATDTAFKQPPREQTVRCKCAGLLRPSP